MVWLFFIIIVVCFQVSWVWNTMSLMVNVKKAKLREAASAAKKQETDAKLDEEPKKEK